MRYELLKAIRTSNIENVGSGWVQHTIVSVKPGHVAEMIRRLKPEFVQRIS